MHLGIYKTRERVSCWLLSLRRVAFEEDTRILRGQRWNPSVYVDGEHYSFFFLWASHRRIIMKFTGNVCFKNLYCCAVKNFVRWYGDYFFLHEER